MSQQKPDAAPELTYEQARDQLVAVVRDLESGNAGLSDAMRLWERGESLAAICQRHLDGARATIERAKAERAPSEG